MMNLSAPYKGLEPFREEDNAAYFGREDELERGVKRLIKNRYSKSCRKIIHLISTAIIMRLVIVNLYDNYDRPSVYMSIGLLS